MWSEAVDAFTCDWGGEDNWLFPPVYLIPRVIRHAQATCATKGTLIVPRWTSAPFWSILFPNGIDQENFISSCLALSNALILLGYLGVNLFSGFLNTPVLAIRFQF